MGAFDYLEWTYNGAFEQLFRLGRGEFEQKFSKNSNARAVARGGMFKLRFDWHISLVRYSPSLLSPLPFPEPSLLLVSIRNQSLASRAEGSRLI